jgi:hypothetical protein
MNHPFALNVSDLEAIELHFEEELNDEEAAQVLGGLTIATTKAVGEEGGTFTTLAVGEEGGGIQCISAPCPGSETGENPPKPTHPPTKPPVATKAWFEAGGHSFC